MSVAASVTRLSVEPLQRLFAVPQQPRWWTDADQAELEALVSELADGVAEHRPRCISCAAEYPPCPHVRTAIETVVDWLRRRELRSRAQWLRAQRDALEANGR